MRKKYIWLIVSILLVLLTLSALLLLSSSYWKITKLHKNKWDPYFDYTYEANKLRYAFTSDEIKANNSAAELIIKFDEMNYNAHVGESKENNTEYLEMAKLLQNSGNYLIWYKAQRIQFHKVFIGLTSVLTIAFASGSSYSIYKTVKLFKR
ncbi:hypothetical protein NXS15_01225 [Mycoplasma sp. CSL7475-4]|uniref:hypothetical protein n=1 Tax=Mycoplasma sp. CSL7475-4 TaxID=2973942 RepID=UPI00216B4116|nr:hypothetical protein [Mycoplasma sp. CSL7475-4]MCS4536752.1 hypothetical protein [Mycoplasma sp. CSL7475-4]